MEFSQAEQCLSGLSDGDYSAAMSAISEALKSYQKGIASLTVRIYQSCLVLFISLLSYFHTEAQNSFFVTLIMFCLQAASTPLSPLTFQCEFVKLRIDTLQALSQLICTCNSLKTSPPPAIATTIALSSGSDLQRCGRISTQVLKNIYMSNLYACIFLCVFICFSDSLSILPKILTSNCLRMACLLYVFCI